MTSCSIANDIPPVFTRAAIHNSEQTTASSTPDVRPVFPVLHLKRASTVASVVPPPPVSFTKTRCLLAFPTSDAPSELPSSTVHHTMRDEQQSSKQRQPTSHCNMMVLSFLSWAAFLGHSRAITECASMDVPNLTKTVGLKILFQYVHPCNVVSLSTTTVDFPQKKEGKTKHKMSTFSLWGSHLLSKQTWKRTF